MLTADQPVVDSTAGTLRVTAASRPDGGYLLGHLLRFGRMLRTMGVDASLSQVLDVVEALAYVPIADRDGFYCTARALLVHRREDRPVFDQAFALFWQSLGPETAEDGRDDGPSKRARLPALPQPPSGEGKAAETGRAAPGGEGDDQAGASEGFKLYSRMETLRRKDFSEMTWEEMQEVKRAIAGLEWKVGRHLTRRYRRGQHGRLDVRRVIRDNLCRGGEPVWLAYRRRTYRPRPLVVLCDVSGSMERYSRMLLHFVHALSHGLTGVEVQVFAFGTRLTHITHHLRHKDVDQSMDEVADAVKDWSGGTRIGEAIKTFNFEWARRVLGRGGVMLIISDGWDRGDGRLLAGEMARLQRTTHRLIWLNPLLGAGTYEPVQYGMAAALPYVDDFLPVRNLASLEQLAQALSSLGTYRPERKQQRPVRSGEPVETGNSNAALERLVAQEHPFLARLYGFGNRVKS